MDLLFITNNFKKTYSIFYIFYILKGIYVENKFSFSELSVICHLKCADMLVKFDYHPSRNHNHGNKRQHPPHPLRPGRVSIAVEYYAIVLYTGEH